MSDMDGKGNPGVMNCKKKNRVSFWESIDSYAFQNDESKFSFILGKDTEGQIVIGDIANLSDILILGSTGSGKTVCIKSIIMSILYKNAPKDVRMIIIDPKKVEYMMYNRIPHMLRPVVTDPKEAVDTLNWIAQEIDKRFKIFNQHNVRDLEEFNKKAEENSANPECSEYEELHVLPRIIVVVDELADLMMVSRKETENAIVMMAMLGRTAGIHMIIATQNLSENVITGTIRVMTLSKIAFSVFSETESRAFFGFAGAEKLQGMGDMLYRPIGSGEPMRVQGTFVSEEDEKSVADCLRKQYGDFE